LNRFSAWQFPLLSFYSRDLYRDVFRNRKGTCFLYLFFLLAICWLPFLIKWHFVFAQLEKASEKIIVQIPTITFNHGAASVAAPQPYVIKDPETQKRIVVIDTTGAINSLEQAQAPILVKSNEAIIRKSKVEQRSFTYQKLDGFVLTQEKVRRWTDWTKRYLPLLLYPIAVLLSFIYRVLQVLLYSAIGTLFASTLGLESSYDAIIRVSVVALTPLIIIKAILDLAMIQVPFAPLWLFLAEMCYLYFGLKACVGKNEPEAPIP
jgi:hypothetical protein